MADFIYNNYKGEAMKGNVDLENDTIKLMLLTDSYTPDQDSQSYYSDISANEISATGYTAGGETLTVTVTVDNANDKSTCDAGNVQWTITSSADIRYAIAYQDTGTDSTSRLIQLFDLGDVYSIANGTFDFEFNASGLFDIS